MYEIVALAAERIAFFSRLAIKSLGDSSNANDDPTRREDAEAVTGQLLGCILDTADGLKGDIGEIVDHFYVRYTKRLDGPPGPATKEGEA